MQNKILNFLKKFSIVTTHPNDDWLKIFVILLVIAIASLGWNVSFYSAVKKDMEALEKAGESKAVQVNASEEQKIRDVTSKYDDRAAVHQGIIESPPTEVADPAGA